MTHKIRLGLFLATFLLCSCWGGRTVKQVRWHDAEFKLTESSGGATTAFSHKVTVLREGWFGQREDELFQAYGGPHVTNIRVEDSTLVLLGLGEGRGERIELSLQHLEDLINNPIVYHRFNSQKTNSFYQEPSFIEAQRKSELEIDSYNQHQRAERERASW